MDHSNSELPNSREADCLYCPSKVRNTATHWIKIKGDLKFVCPSHGPLSLFAENVVDRGLLPDGPSEVELLKAEVAHWEKEQALCCRLASEQLPDSSEKPTTIAMCVVGLGAEIERLQEENAKLRAAGEALDADAARYRMLKKAKSGNSGVQKFGPYTTDGTLTGHSLRCIVGRVTRWKTKHHRNLDDALDEAIQLDKCHDQRLE